MLKLTAAPDGSGSIRFRVSAERFPTLNVDAIPRSIDAARALLDSIDGGPEAAGDAEGFAQIPDPGFDPFALLEQIRERVGLECDLEHLPTQIDGLERLAAARGRGELELELAHAMGLELALERGVDVAGSAKARLEAAREIFEAIEIALPDEPVRAIDGTGLAELVRSRLTSGRAANAELVRLRALELGVASELGLADPADVDVELPSSEQLLEAVTKQGERNVELSTELATLERRLRAAGGAHGAEPIDAILERVRRLYVDAGSPTDTVDPDAETAPDPDVASPDEPDPEPASGPTFPAPTADPPPDPPMRREIEAEIPASNEGEKSEGPIAELVGALAELDAGAAPSWHRAGEIRGLRTGLQSDRRWKRALELAVGAGAVETNGQNRGACRYRRVAGGVEARPEPPRPARDARAPRVGAGEDLGPGTPDEIPVDDPDLPVEDLPAPPPLEPGVDVSKGTPAGRLHSLLAFAELRLGQILAALADVDERRVRLELGAAVREGDVAFRGSPRKYRAQM